MVTMCVLQLRFSKKYETMGTRKPFPTQANHSRLEERWLLAGDVQIVVVDSILNFFGDSESNQIQLTQTDDGSLTATGLDTTINGATGFTIDESFVLGRR